MSKRALIVHGGWAGHEPRVIAEILGQALMDNGVQVTLSDTLDAFRNEKKLDSYDLLVPHWTMGQIEKDQLAPLLGAVGSGVGFAGVHGGAGDAFRQETEFQFMVGGQWVAHPGGILDYDVRISDPDDPICVGLGDFRMHTEQYYLHVDPSNHVLATTTFSFNGCVMPVAWKRQFGHGRVFYCSLGHKPDDFDVPEAAALITRGMLWAAGVE